VLRYIIPSLFHLHFCFKHLLFVSSCFIVDLPLYRRGRAVSLRLRFCDILRLRFRSRSVSKRVGNFRLITVLWGSLSNISRLWFRCISKRVGNLRLITVLWGSLSNTSRLRFRSCSVSKDREFPFNHGSVGFVSRHSKTTIEGTKRADSLTSVAAADWCEGQ
jgi:hypothetical protein